jgi:hypothetical protein
VKPRKTSETKKNLLNQEKPVKSRKTYGTKKNLRNINATTLSGCISELNVTVDNTKILISGELRRRQ